MKKFISCSLVVVGHWAYALGPDYQWVSVRKVSLSSGIHATGRVIPREGGRIVEAARVQGRITGILKREGQQVWVGSPLFSISSGDCSSLAEEKRVAEVRGLSDLLESTKRREQQLGLRLVNRECQILANHKGVLIKRQVELGQNFNMGDALATTLDSSHLSVELDVPEHDVASVKVGQLVSFQIATKAGKKFSAPIEQIVPAIDQASRTVKIRLASVPLPSGINVDALVFGDIKADSQSEVLSVPTAALVFSQSKQYVVKKTKEGSSSVEVRVLSEAEENSSITPEVSSELSDGDLVATKGALFLFRQMQMRPSS